MSNMSGLSIYNIENRVRKSSLSIMHNYINFLFVYAPTIKLNLVPLDVFRLFA